MIGAFDWLLAAAGAALLVLLLVVVLLGVVTRAQGDPLIWTDEGARFLMVWLACCGWMIAGRRRAHVRIRYFQGLLPARLHWLVERVIQALLVVFGAAVAWFGWGLVRRNAGLEATSLPISMAWLYVPLVPAGAMLAVQGLVQLVERGGVSAAANPIGEGVIE